MILSCVFVFFCFVVLLFYGFHYMVMLLCLELAFLGLLFFLVGWGLSEVGMVMVFSFFLVGVCFGGFRISFLVSLSRCWGRDYWGGVLAF